MITKLAPVAFDDAASCPTWIAFLECIFAGDHTMIDFVQRAVGYSLTASTREQCFFVCFGGGANGKSTLLEMLRTVLGDYAQNGSTDTFMASKQSRGPENDIARLRGARTVTACEAGEARRLDEELIKRLTGSDTVTARFLYHEHFEFVPAFKLWLAVNDRPEIRGVDLGIWRRVRLIPFNVTILPEDQDRELPTKLRAEAAGILRWAVDGCLSWQREGLHAPAGVTSATAEWRESANVVAAFIDDACVRSDHAQCKTSVIYSAYQEWSRAQGSEPLAQVAFARRLTAIGLTAGRGNQGRYWLGVGLRAHERHDA